MLTIELDSVYLTNTSVLMATLEQFRQFYLAHQSDDRLSLYKKITITTGRNRHKKRRDVYVPLHAEHKDFHKILSRRLPGPYHPQVFSYIRSKSRKDAAQCHAQSFEIFCIDIKDFFPSIPESLVEELYTAYFEKLLSSHILSPSCFDVVSTREYAKMIAWSVTLPHPTRTDIGECVLTLGNEVAPQIARMVLYDVDTTIGTLCDTGGYRYSRYSDNLYVSHPTERIPDDIKRRVIDVIEQFTYTDRHGVSHRPFVVHPDKLRSKYRFSRQQILGVTVNHHATLSVDRIERTRHALHNLFCEIMDIATAMRAMTISSADAQLRYLACAKRKVVVFGYLNECAAIDRDKYVRKFLRKRIATQALFLELERSLNWYALRQSQEDSNGFAQTAAD